MASEAVAASRFGITVDGVSIASFSELQGISTEVDVIEHIESTDDGRSRHEDSRCHPPQG